MIYSTNGTYINKKCVGKNKTYILQHSDEISLSSNRGMVLIIDMK